MKLKCHNPDCVDGKDKENFDTTCADCYGTGQYTYIPMVTVRLDWLLDFILKQEKKHE